MSGFGRWSLGIGLALVAVAVVCRLLDQISATVIIGILGLIGVGVAGYDAIYEASTRAGRRRRG